MKAGTESTIKFKKLKMALRAPEYQVVGILESIWRLTATSTPEGDIGRFSNEDIKLSIEYEGDIDHLINTLVECGWLDVHDTFRLVVHNWSEHAPNYVKANIKKHKKQFANVVQAESESEVSSGAPQPESGPPNDTQGAPQGVQGAPQGVQGAPQGVQGAPQGAQGAPTKSSQVKSSQVKSSQAKPNHTKPDLVEERRVRAREKAPDQSRADEYADAFVAYMNHIDGARGFVQPSTTVEQMLIQLYPFGHDKAVADMRYTIDGGWKKLCDSSSDRSRGDPQQSEDEGYDETKNIRVVKLKQRGAQ